MLETNLEAPILGLAAGKFLPNTSNLGLAVLHPRKLVVYNVVAVGGTGANASYYDVHKVCHLNNHNNVFSLCP